MKETLSPKERDDLVKYRLQRTDETIEEADYNAAGRYYNAAVNRLYYAAYYAVSALLISDGLIATTHAGVKTMLSMHYIKTGKVDRSYGLTFATLFDSRQSGDYEDFVYCDEELYESLKPLTLDLIKVVKSLIAINLESER